MSRGSSVRQCGIKHPIVDQAAIDCSLSQATLLVDALDRDRSVMRSRDAIGEQRGSFVKRAAFAILEPPAVTLDMGHIEIVCLKCVVERIIVPDRHAAHIAPNPIRAENVSDPERRTTILLQEEMCRDPRASSPIDGQPRDVFIMPDFSLFVLRAQQ